ncbi:hypothetical protein B5F76_13265 [Desulfovibrio sp. An276]|nr:hypothetical protein B5F76_13265 [Desulfovibrio sp. An276]
METGTRRVTDNQACKAGKRTQKVKNTKSEGHNLEAYTLCPHFFFASSNCRKGQKCASHS